MVRTDEITNTADVIDSRDVIARIDELQGEFDDTEDGSAERQEWCDEYGGELESLKTLAAEAEGYAADWHHGEALIRDSYFTEHAQQLAEDCGMVNREAAWPNNHLDWEAAADELKGDYTSVDFDGTTYWIR